MISVIQLGSVDYATALRLQQKLVEMRKTGEVGDTLLLLEHPPVITLGRNAKAANVVASAEELRAAGVEVYECDRGGDVTYHGPGQLVGYPVFDLRGFSPAIGAVEFVRRLEEVLIRTCATFGIAAERKAGMTGAWTKTSQAKIAAIGVHISRAVTSHGFALNVNTNLAHFDLIVPCGLTQKPVTSMFRELGKEVALDDVAQAVAAHFGEVFASEVTWVDTLDALAGRAVGVPLQAPEELRRLRGEEDTRA